MDDGASVVVVLLLGAAMIVASLTMLPRARRGSRSRLATGLLLGALAMGAVFVVVGLRLLLG